jgi:hypothetical protein
VETFSDRIFSSSRSERPVNKLRWRSRSVREGKKKLNYYSDGDGIGIGIPWRGFVFEGQREKRLRELSVQKG